MGTINSANGRGRGTEALATGTFGRLVVSPSLRIWKWTREALKTNLSPLIFAFPCRLLPRTLVLIQHCPKPPPSHRKRIPLLIERLMARYGNEAIGCSLTRSIFLIFHTQQFLTRFSSLVLSIYSETTLTSQVSLRKMTITCLMKSCTKVYPH